MDRNDFMDRQHMNYSHGQPPRPVGIQNVSPGESEDTPKNKDSDISLQGFGWCPTADHPQFLSQVSYWLHKSTTCHLYISPKKRAALYGNDFSSVMASAPPASDPFNEYIPGTPEEFSNRQTHMNGPGSYQVGMHGVGDVPVFLTSVHLACCGPRITASTYWGPASTARSQLFVNSLGRQCPDVSLQHYHKTIA